VNVTGMVMALQTEAIAASHRQLQDSRRGCPMGKSTESCLFCPVRSDGTCHIKAK